MEFESRTIILSTPEALLPLITEAVRLAGYEKTQNASEYPTKNCLPRKTWRKSSAFTRKRLPTGVWKVLARHIRASAGAFSMNAPCWKSILQPGAFQLRNQDDELFSSPAYLL